MHGQHTKELNSGKRFAFGSNWAKFLRGLNETRIVEAELSLQRMLKVDHLRGKRVLDVGSGSGLFSLAARRLGAIVHSFDYDPESVACTQQLRQRNDPTDIGWTVEPGSVLDADYLRTLGSWDIVYSWGVLHHTGAMWDALGNVAPLVAPRILSAHKVRLAARRTSRVTFDCGDVGIYYRNNTRSIHFWNGKP